MDRRMIIEKNHHPRHHDHRASNRRHRIKTATAAVWWIYGLMLAALLIVSVLLSASLSSYHSLPIRMVTDGSASIRSTMVIRSDKTEPPPPRQLAGKETGTNRSIVALYRDHNFWESYELWTAHHRLNTRHLPIGSRKETPLPLHVLEQYIAHHSVDQLRQESRTALRQRRYAVAFYSCPLQAGNRLHHFMNSLLWAIVTNRTLLWHYYDAESCWRLGFVYDNRICEAANTEQDCNVVLERASWMASYHDWISHIVGSNNKPDGDSHNTTISSSEVVELNFWSTHPKALATANGTDFRNGRFTLFHRVGSRKFPYKPEYAVYTGLDDTGAATNNPYANIPVVIFPIMLDKYRDLQQETYRHELLRTDAARERAKLLYSWGVDFMYGLLFRWSFVMQPVVTTITTTVTMGQSTTTAAVEHSNHTSKAHQVGLGSVVSIGLHTRHRDEKNFGLDVAQEVRCIQHLLSKYDSARNHTSKCFIYLMSDRNGTLQSLQDALSFQANQSPASDRIDSLASCRIVTAVHETVGQSFKIEHGPYAGLGYFQDWYLVASNARHGFIGADRSSSHLVLEVLELDRQMEAWAAQAASPHQQLHQQHSIMGMYNNSNMNQDQNRPLLPPIPVCRLGL